MPRARRLDCWRSALASLRLVQGKYEEALAPAQLGLRILEARGAEARGAHFLVARAELGADGDAEDAARLRDLIAGNRTRPELVVHIHHGSVELATWAMREHRFGEARDAWRIAGETANNSFFGAHYGRGVSRIGEAAAMLYAEADRPPYRIDAETNATIQTMFEEGLESLWRTAGSDRHADEISRDEQAYAQGLAWYRVWRSYVEDQGTPARANGKRVLAHGYWNEFADDEPENACDIRVVSRPPPRLPTETDHVDAAAPASSGCASTPQAKSPSGALSLSPAATTSSSKPSTAIQTAGASRSRAPGRPTALCRKAPFVPWFSDFSIRAHP